ncbi:hypothetical protein ALC62_13867 [Cyphomyrmex costatus]|uniref:Uncharacterized protein n=1 Tax=Cyphomyrmex costatus TaxID=456900 RepID=A0A195C3J7_9HYME|nr:hypothetical protein ALC62_13867 [Cyphomyrmex costatus]
MEFLGEFLERRALSSAACFVTYRRLPAYKKPNGGRSDPPPYNPRVSPVPRSPPTMLFRPLYGLITPGFTGVLVEQGVTEGEAGEVAGERDRITPLSVLTAKTRNWRTM